MFGRGRPTPRPHGANRLLWQVDYIYDVLLKDVAVARENLEVRTRRQHPCTRCPPPALLPPARREPLTLRPRRRPDCIRSPSARTFSRPTPSTSSTRTWPRQKHWRSWPRHCRREAEALTRCPSSSQLPTATHANENAATALATRALQSAPQSAPQAAPQSAPQSAPKAFGPAPLPPAPRARAMPRRHAAAYSPPPPPPGPQSCQTRTHCALTARSLRTYRTLAAQT
jgi:hypothetical protein